MALMKRLQKSAVEITPIDITHNLESLQFESALNDDERQLLVLRKRSHALVVTMCTQATFFANILHEARQIKKQMKSPQKMTAKILQDKDSRDPLKVGIIGCGRLGSQLAHCLLTYGRVNPKDLKVSTRRPETLEYLQNKGVDCFHDNIKLASTSHVVFICVLPSHVQVVAEEIKEHIPVHTIIYSFVAAYSVQKLKQILQTTNILKPDLTWTKDSEQNSWDCSENVNTALENPVTVEKTCPFGNLRSECVILTNEKFGELMIFALLNMCTTLRLNKADCLTILHTTLFGDISEDKLQESDFIKKNQDMHGVFPRFDLVKVSQVNTSVQKRVSSSEHLRKAFINRYLTMFEEYVKRKALLGPDMDES
ncbi:NADP-dependent oxidoreductase domain-containing protein 1-like [Saccostrea echinata]|uniref:NADP-dependent oxidoreductase domain-containing protein 1-like n=1 Tax=Saccostrea echinata TaxID=191078 RepID=UPI002A83DF9F|nr:NADP-dependent oxidoreductase domain-containing protein 1-like [Saccostrea echinata]